jgi:hypothetical protein
VPKSELFNKRESMLNESGYKTFNVTGPLNGNYFYPEEVPPNYPCSEIRTELPEFPVYMYGDGKVFFPLVNDPLVKQEQEKIRNILGIKR